MPHLGTRVADFVDGQLTADAAADAQEHLTTCPDCRQAVLAHREVKRRMTGLGAVPAPPASLLQSLADLDRVRAAADRRGGLRARVDHLVRSSAFRGLVAATGAAVVVGACAYGLGAPAASAAAPTVPPVSRFVAAFGSADLATPSSELVQAAMVRPTTAVRTAGTATVSDDPEAVGLLRSAGVVPDLDLVVRNFDVRLGATSLVDGVRATEVVATSDGRRESAYWVATRTGAVVRAVGYDDDGTPRDLSLRPAAGTVAASTPISDAGMTSLTRSGWPCHERLARDLDRVEGSFLESDSERIVSLAYTDGLSRVSLYEQSGSLDADSLDGFRPTRLGATEVWLREGSPTVATWDEDGVVFTVVTDAGTSRLAEVVVDLPHRVVDVGAVARVQRGLERMTRAADPLRG
ncbi:MAG: zf-HC2 domain-containing protein [Nocardioidaceae bacterium]|nr:zf-HC2 domain-containing protein [Nocardioidaceae bacterium]